MAKGVRIVETRPLSQKNSAAVEIIQKAEKIVQMSLESWEFRVKTDLRLLRQNLQTWTQSEIMICDADLFNGRRLPGRGTITIGGSTCIKLPQDKQMAAVLPGQSCRIGAAKREFYNGYREWHAKK